MSDVQKAALAISASHVFISCAVIFASRDLATQLAAAAFATVHFTAFLFLLPSSK